MILANDCKCEKMCNAKEIANCWSCHKNSDAQSFCGNFLRDMTKPFKRFIGLSANLIQCVSKFKIFYFVLVDVSYN